MRVLYFINAGIMGGRERHVYTLVKSLPRTVDYVVCAVSAGEATKRMTEEGLNVCVLGGRNGHDWHVIPRFIKLLRTFRPDIIHAHTTAFFPFIILCFFRNIPVIESLHAPTSLATGSNDPFIHKHSVRIASLIGHFSRKPDYYLPVALSTWKGFIATHPTARGEVFYNALNLSALPPTYRRTVKSSKFIGMVARMADQKDWPSFVSISAAVMSQDPTVEAWAIGDGPVRDECERLWFDLARKNQLDPNRLKWLGTRQDARELIAQMDVFLLTSKHEQLPTTILEAFALRTPVVGFLPIGGTGEILAFAKGTCALLNAKRSVETAAADVLRVLRDEQLRAQMTAEGERIVREHFDMQKICATQLIKIYTQVIKEKKS